MLWALPTAKQEAILMTSCFYLLGSHLFPPNLLPVNRAIPILMVEDFELYTRFSFHKKRLAFLIESMRNHADLLEKEGYEVIYVELASGKETFRQNISKLLKKHKITLLQTFEIEDRFLRADLTQVVNSLKIDWDIYDCPLFLHTTEEYQELLGNKKRPFMRTFYEAERKRRGILMTQDGPKGGRYSFDDENRLRLPKSVEIPKRKIPRPSPHHQEVCDLVEKIFKNHPGSTEGCWLPTTRKAALKALEEFIEVYLTRFGPYEDAITSRDPFLFHSALSPLINVGLLTPEEVLEAVLSAKEIPLNSLEGYVRQLIGWREFIRGIDECFGERQESSNFFNHTRKLTKSWYNGNTGIPPLDDAISKVVELSYCHHIERLMVLSNLMLLSEIDPKEVYRWFMELFSDSAEWVMGPNVYGMGQFSDGGIFATKPYLCGSNYLLKMSDYAKGEWCETVDGLYWRFVDKHRSFFQKQPRLKMMTASLDRMDPAKKKRLFEKAEAFINSHTN